MPRHLLLLLALTTLPALVLPAHAGRPGKVAAQKQGGVVKGIGKVVGFAAGFGVTAGLALSRKWNAPLRDGGGRPVTIEASGHRYTLKQRHAAVLGPKIAARAAKMPERSAPQRFFKRFVTGVGEGATAAPPAQARFEGSLAGKLKTWK